MTAPSASSTAVVLARRGDSRVGPCPSPRPKVGASNHGLVADASRDEDLAGREQRGRVVVAAGRQLTDARPSTRDGSRPPRCAGRCSRQTSPDDQHSAVSEQRSRRFMPRLAGLVTAQRRTDGLQIRVVASGPLCRPPQPPTTSTLPSAQCYLDRPARASSAPDTWSPCATTAPATSSSAASTPADTSHHPRRMSPPPPGSYVACDFFPPQIRVRRASRRCTERRAFPRRPG